MNNDEQLLLLFIEFALDSVTRLVMLTSRGVMW